MNIFEIDKAIEAALENVDVETGELLNFDAMEALQVERDVKIENGLLYYKNLAAEAEAIKTEITKLSERRQAAERKAESLFGYLEAALHGDAFKTPRAEVKYRKSTSVEVADDVSLLSWALSTDRRDLLIEKAPTISKKAIGDAIKAGDAIPYAEIVEHNNMRVI